MKISQKKEGAHFLGKFHVRYQLLYSNLATDMKFPHNKLLFVVTLSFRKGEIISQWPVNIYLSLEFQTNIEKTHKGLNFWSGSRQNDGLNIVSSRRNFLKIYISHVWCLIYFYRKPWYNSSFHKMYTLAMTLQKR